MLNLCLTLQRHQSQLQLSHRFVEIKVLSASNKSWPPAHLANTSPLWKWLQSWGRICSFSLTLHTPSFWCACQRPTQKNWFAMWFRFEGQISLWTWTHQYLLPGNSKLTALAANILCLFWTVYVCEHVFSGMDINKTKLWLTHRHLNYIVKLAATQVMTPNIDAFLPGQKMPGLGSKDKVF